jgi:hypothetical protein
MKKQYYLIAACYDRKSGEYYAESDGHVFAASASGARKMFKAQREAELKLRVEVEHCDVAE